MATLIHTFTIPETLPITVGIYYEYPYVFYQAVQDGALTVIPPETVVDPADLGFGLGETMYFECVGVNLVRVVAEYSIPFASIQEELNSLSCGYVPPDLPPDTPPGSICFTESAVVNYTNESQQGLMDGSITAEVSFSSGSTEYSLDNINWQSSGSFTGLLPGTYQLRARKVGDPSCTFLQAIIIAAGVAIAAIDYPWQDKLCFWFKLIRNGIEYSVSEPIKWDQVTIVGKRDKDWHGWLYQYSDGVIELEFDCPAGKDVIEAEYQSKGSDGEVFFQYGYTHKGTDTTLFNAKLNLNTFKRLQGRVAASTERSELSQLFTSRVDTKVKMNQTTTVDDEVVIPPTTYETTLHAKEIVRSFSFVTSDAIEGYSQFSYDANDKAYLFPSTSRAQAAEITKFFSKDLDVSGNAPDTVENYTWDLDFAGTYDFNIYFKVKVQKVTPVLTTPSFQLYLQVNATKYVLGPLQNILMNDTTTIHELIFSGTVTGLALFARDKVYLYVEIIKGIGQTDYEWNLWQENTNITITALEQAPQSQANGWFIHEAMDHCIKVITNNQSELRSRLLSRASFYFPSDGEGSLNLTTNGKQIRNFNVSENPLIISLKDLLASVQAIYCVGFGFEKSGSKEIVRVERVGYFYQNRQILVIEEAIDYKEEAAKDLLYNEIDIGYDKYQDSGYNTNDESNTRHEYLTSIRTNKLKLTQKSKLITSGYKIEDVRRQQFLETGKDSYSNDDDGFMISMRRVDGATFLPEKNEAFAVLSNVISPETVYNARLTPLRMLINWSEWLNNCFHYKTGTDKIRNTYVAQNGKMVSQLEATDQRPVGDVNRASWTENQDVLLSDYLVSERIFRPEWITFKCRLTPDKVALINDALMGRSTNTVNYGYLTVKDTAGDYQGLFPYEIEYNFYTEQATVKGLKKWDSPVDPNAECCNPLHVNGCKLLINSNELIVQ